MDERTKRIAALNDEFRTTFNPRLGRVMLSRGLAELPDEDRQAILDLVKTFNHFSQHNDPHAEHDFGSVLHSGNTAFWKIDYYAPDMLHGSEDPADPKKTNRVLTIMLASEY